MTPESKMLSLFKQPPLQVKNVVFVKQPPLQVKKWFIKF
jgi:hypothetical protein